VLLQAELISPPGGGAAQRASSPTAATVAPIKLLAGLLVALIIGALVVWLLATVIK
jgi:hypothetical protein